MPKKNKPSLYARTKKNVKRLRKVYLTGLMISQYDRGHYYKAFYTHQKIRSI